MDGGAGKAKGTKRHTGKKEEGEDHRQSPVQRDPVIVFQPNPLKSLHAVNTRQRTALTRASPSLEDSSLSSLDFVHIGMCIAHMHTHVPFGGRGLLLIILSLKAVTCYLLERES